MWKWKQAAENRSRFGRDKGKKAADRQNEGKRVRDLDGKELEKPSDKAD